MPGWYALLVPFLLPLAQIGLTGSIYLTVSISVERYTTVCHPFFKLTHKWPSYYYILPSVLFSVLFNIPRFLELETVEKPSEDKVILDITATELRQNIYYRHIYIIYLNLLVHGLLPLSSLLFMNISIYRNLKQFSGDNPCVENPRDRDRSRRLSEVTLARISCIIVGVFVVCHSIRWLPNIYEMRQGVLTENQLEWPDWVSSVTQISHLLTVFNSSVNFYIYQAKHYTRKQPTTPIRPSRSSFLSTHLSSILH